MPEPSDRDWQASEEARHDGAASLTAVRIWPAIAPLVVGPKERARARFIKIITAYKVLVWREATVPTRTEVLEFRALKRHLRDKDTRAFLARIDTLRRTPAGKRALVRYHQVVRHQEEEPAHPTIAGYDNPELLKSAANVVQKAMKSNSRRQGPGRSARDAARRVVRTLRVWWDREIAQAHGPGRLRDGSFSSHFIDFLFTINQGLHAEVSSNQIARSTLASSDIASRP